MAKSASGALRSKYGIPVITKNTGVRTRRFLRDLAGRPVDEACGEELRHAGGELLEARDELALHAQETNARRSGIDDQWGGVAGVMSWSDFFFGV